MTVTTIERTSTAATIVEQALAMEEAQLATGDLTSIVQAFTAVTERLQSAHTSLESETRRLKEELRQTNEQLHRSRQLAALGQMAAGIAHEIRNPLGSIRLFATMLEEDLVEAPASRNLAEKIGRAVRDLDAIVSDVLTFSRDIHLRPGPVSPTELFSHSLDACRDLLRASAVRVARSEFDRADEWPVYVDAGLMNQALTNVIRNAVQAMEDGGTLTLDWRPVRFDPEGDAEERPVTPENASAVTLIIRDEGPGITPEVLEHMFNPFFTTRSTGTGLGLAIVHRIIDGHGGRIEIRNNIERGATVEITLPRPPQAETEEISS